MAWIKLNARDMIIEQGDGALVPTWTEVAGLTSFMTNPSENEETAETTTFKDKGNYRQEKMQKGSTIEVEGFRISDSLTGDVDPGQLAVEDQHEKLGPESEGPIRFRHELETEWTVWNCTTTVGEKGGEVNDKMSWACTWTRSGPSSKVEVSV